jgi:hypothetical protein
LSHAQLVEAHKTMVGPVAGLRLTISLNRSRTLTATTLAALPRPGRACFVTYTSAQPSSSTAVLAAVQPTIRFP